MSKDYYNILGVDKNASADEIKKAYRKMAVKYHPDKNQGDKESEEKFKEVSEAYDTLSTPDKKKNYDMFGSDGGNRGGQHQYAHGFNMEDIFSQFGDVFGSSFNNKYNRRQKKGSDLRIKVQLTLDEILKGANKKLKFKRNTKCNTCDGKGGDDLKDCLSCSGTGQRVVVQNSPFGQVRHSTTCNNCNGSGKIVHNKCKNCNGEGTESKEEVVDVEIPAGLSGGMQLSMSGNGNFVRDGVNGDLQIFIEEIPDPVWKRENNNLRGELTISVIDAILGKKMEIQTPHGKMEVNIEGGTDSGRVFKYTHKGIPDVNYGLGDLFIVVNVKIPKKINPEEKVIIEKLRSSKNFNI
jgi:molecular chaperone DnaJ